MTEQNFEEASGRVLASIMLNWQKQVQKYFHDTVEIQTIMYFLYVASKAEPVDVTNVANALSLTKAAASRNYYRLSVGLRGTQGLGLIESIDDPNDYRRKLLQLTPKGYEVSKTLGGSLYNAVLNRISKVS